jgi:hypothetical protein
LPGLLLRAKSFGPPLRCPLDRSSMVENAAAVDIFESPDPVFSHHERKWIELMKINGAIGLSYDRRLKFNCQQSVTLGRRRGEPN